MFDLMPFNRREDNLFHYLDNLEKNFWGDLATNVSSFRTDVLDKGDKFVLEAELPGFQKRGYRYSCGGQHSDHLRTA